MDDDRDANAIADLIKLDASLASATLRLANSAMFVAGSVETITEAVVRLGHRELHRLTLLVLLSRWASATSADAGNVCRRALCTALAAEVLAEHAVGVDPQATYTAGLMCDVGKLAVAHACAAQWEEIRGYCRTTRATWEQGELAVLGYTHGQVGLRLLQSWNFPAELAIVAGFCEAPRNAPAHAWPLLALVHAAKYLAASFGPGIADEDFLFALDPALLVEHGLTDERLQEALLIVQDRARQRLGSRLTHGAVV